MMASSAGVNGGLASPPPRQPEERQEYRKSLHKSCSHSPHWKGAYRERCKKRLRESREKFMTRFRNITSSERTEEDPAISRSSTESPLAAASRGATGARVPSPSSLASSVQEVVMEEWEHVRTEFGNLPSIPQSTRSKVEHLTSSQDDLFMSEELEADVELVLSIMDELTEELIKEEQALLAQYEEDLKFNEDALCDAVQSLHTNDIICPVCQKDYLRQNKHVIFCSCGLRLDTAHDGISLDYIRRQLDHYSLEHSSQCRGKPVFSVETVIQTQTIIMNCPTCCFMEIIV